MSDLLITSLGFVVINVLSLVIAARVKKHMIKYAPLTHVLVLFIAAYYLVDLLLSRRMVLSDLYFYLWISVILTQIVFGVLAQKAIARQV